MGDLEDPRVEGVLGNMGCCCIRAEMGLGVRVAAGRGTWGKETGCCGSWTTAGGVGTAAIVAAAGWWSVGEAAPLPLTE